MDESVRGSREAFEMVMAAYALGSLLGVHEGTASATTTWSKSADMLKRMGGRFVRSYYDPQFKSNMEEISLICTEETLNMMVPFSRQEKSCGTSW